MNTDDFLFSAQDFPIRVNLLKSFFAKEPLRLIKRNSNLEWYFDGKMPKELVGIENKHSLTIGIIIVGDENKKPKRLIIIFYEWKNCRITNSYKTILDKLEDGTDKIIIDECKIF